MWRRSRSRSLLRKFFSAKIIVRLVWLVRRKALRFSALRDGEYCRAEKRSAFRHTMLLAALAPIRIDNVTADPINRIQTCRDATMKR